MNVETRATGICNPYEPPQELTPDRMAFSLVVVTTIAMYMNTRDSADT